MGHRTLLAVVMLAGPAALAAAGTSEGFNLEAPQNSPKDTFLESDSSCSLMGCYIGYSLRSDVLDMKIKLKWTGVSGAILWQGGWDPTGPDEVMAAADGMPVTTTWSSRRGLFTATIVRQGTADFTGQQGGSAPCGISYICPDIDYLDWNDPFGTPNATAQPAATVAAGVIGEEESVISRRKFNTVDYVNFPLDYTQTDYYRFNSKVEAAGADFIYTYTFTNLTQTDVEFQWTDAGLAGTVNGLRSASRSFVSNLAPAVVRSLGTVMMAGEDTGGAMNMLVPAAVPEPSTWAMMLAGAGLFAWRLRAIRRPAR